jgi:hypothetical protein
MKPLKEHCSEFIGIEEKEILDQIVDDEDDIIDLVTVYTEQQEKIDGVVVGWFAGISKEGAPLVNYPMNRSGRPVHAISTVSLATCEAGRETALMFEGGDSKKPIIIGLMHKSEKKEKEGGEEKTLVISSEDEVMIRCGEASIHLKKDGKVIIKGKDILSRAKRNNDIKGGMINLN